jgi:integrase
VRRLASNPFAGIVKANEKADPRRQRRAMTEAELLRLLPVARERPSLDAMTVRRGPRKGERCAKVRPEVRARLELIGRERALLYKPLVLTGLRKGELASLTVAHLRLDDAVPCLTLDAADEKNREGNDIPLRDDLAADLRDWLAAKLRRLQEKARQAGAAIPARLPPDIPLFTVSGQLCKILNRDLRLVGIPKRDDRGRTLDVHALRRTFGTLLSKGGVAPRTAQAAMRHGKIDLTMNVYTDLALLDVRGALDTLPGLPLRGNPAEGEAMRATGTTGILDRNIHLLAPTLDNPVQTLSFSGKPFTDGPAFKTQPSVAVSADAGKRKQPLTADGSGCPGMEPTGIEPVTSRMPFLGPNNASQTDKGLTASAAGGCTTGCTSEGKLEQDDPLAPLAAALLGLSPAGRARLAAMLLGQQTEQAEGSGHL